MSDKNQVPTFDSLCKEMDSTLKLEDIKKIRDGLGPRGLALVDHLIFVAYERGKTAGTTHTGTIKM